MLIPQVGNSSGEKGRSRGLNKILIPRSHVSPFPQGWVIQSRMQSCMSHQEPSAGWVVLSSIQIIPTLFIRGVIVLLHFSEDTYKVPMLWSALQVSLQQAWGRVLLPQTSMPFLPKLQAWGTRKRGMVGGVPRGQLPAQSMAQKGRGWIWGSKWGKISTVSEAGFS